MTSALSDSPAVAARFDWICGLIASRKRGLRLTELSAAHAIARELKADKPDRAKPTHLARELRIDLQELAHRSSPPLPDPDKPGQQLELAQGGRP